MSDRILRRLRALGWSLFVAGVLVFLIGTDETSGVWMGSGLALLVLGGLLAGLPYALRDQGGDDSPGQRPR